MNHLDAMDFLQEGIGLRGYAQIDPLVAYTNEAYEMWNELMGDPGRNRPQHLPRAPGGREEEQHKRSRVPPRRPLTAATKARKARPRRQRQRRTQRPLPLRQRQEIQKMLRPQSPSRVKKITNLRSPEAPRILSSALSRYEQ